MAQAAGALQGALPGDLGNLGNATLSIGLVNDLLQLALGRHGESLESSSVDEIQQTQLALGAHLIACAQRRCLCSLEHEKIENHTRHLADFLDRIPKIDEISHSGNDSLATSTPDPGSVISHAPFFKHILQRLYDAAVQKTTTRPSDATKSLDEKSLPLLNILRKNASKANHSEGSSKIISLLQIVEKCASEFPAGVCWASSCSCWLELPDIGETESNYSHIHTCDSKDLATVIVVVAKVLECHGDHNGDVGCQEWAFKCLVKLAKSTGYFTFLNGRCDDRILAYVWQDVWRMLFRTDLRYAASTTETTIGGIGENFLFLISAISKNLCTDPSTRWSPDIRARRSSFLYKCQSDVWKLPVFTQMKDTLSLAPFDVIGSLVTSVGLCDGEDSIGEGLVYKAHRDRIYIQDGNRRRRLINFCLETLSYSTNEASFGAAVSTMAALVQGHQGDWSTSLEGLLGKIEGGAARTTVRNIFDTLWIAPRPLLVVCPHVRDSSVLSRQQRQLHQALSNASREFFSADILADSRSSQLEKTLLSALCQTSSISPLLAPVSLSSLQRFLTFLKVCLSVSLTRKKGQRLKSSFNAICPYIVNVLNFVSVNLLTIIQESPCALPDISRIVAFITDVSATSLGHLPYDITDQASELYDALKMFLDDTDRHQYTIQKEVVVPKSAPAATLRDLEDDDLEERLEGRKRARKGDSPADSNSTAKRKRVTKVASFDSGVLNATQLLFSLKPAFDTVRFICERVINVDLDRPLEYYDSNLGVDPIVTAYLAQLVKPLLRLVEMRQMTAASLLCRLILMTRKHAPPYSALHLFGFNEASEFCRQDRFNELKPLSPSDATELLSLWKDLDSTEVRSFALRPSIRATATRTLVRAFVNGDSALRAAWEKEYPKLLLSSMYDLNGLNRLQAAVGVAESLSVMSSQTRVLTSVMKNLPPITNSVKDFREWYSAINNNEMSVARKQTWEDARSNFEVHSLSTLSLMGAKTLVKPLQLTIIFKFVDVAADRPDLEQVVFRFFDLFAQRVGFGSCEDMIAELLEGILEKWLQRSNEMILQAPIALSAPGLSRGLARCLLHDAHFEGDIDIEFIRQKASSDFLVRHMDLVLPRLVILAGSNSRDERLAQLLSLFGEEDYKFLISKLFRKNISCLVATDAVLSSISNNQPRLVASAITSVIGDYTELGKKNLHYISRCFFFVASRFPVESNSYSRIADAFLDLVHKYGDKSQDPFLCAGLTVSECCIMSHAWCGPPLVSWVAQRKIHVIKTVWSIAQRASEIHRTPIQMDFLLLLFSEIFTEFRSSHLSAKALALLNEILLHITEPDSKVKVAVGRGLKREIRVLVVALIRLYREAQAAFADIFTNEATDQQSMRLRLGGLLQQVMQSNAGEEALPKDSKNKKLIVDERNDLLDLLRALYELLKNIAENYERFWLTSAQDFWGLVASVPLDDKVHDEFCNRQPLISLERIRPALSDESHPELFKQMSCPRNQYRNVSERNQNGGLSPHQWLLICDLEQLYVFLSTAEKASDDIAANKSILIRRLSDLLTCAPDRVRRLASKCIGALQPHNSKYLHDQAKAISDARFWQIDFRRGRPDVLLESECLDTLLEIANSHNHGSAITAMVTIKSILSSQNPVQRSEMRVDLFCPSVQKKDGALILGMDEVKQLRSSFDKNITWTEWCWDPAVWRSSISEDFDTWICRIVPALIECHFNQREKGSRTYKLADGFLSSCQRMAQLEPDFAVACLPLIVLRLLQQKHNHDKAQATQVQKDTWIGSPNSPLIKLMSQCISAALDAFLESKQVSEYRAVHLIIDTLDMICQLQRQRFLASDGHFRNPASKKSFDKSSQSSSSSQKARIGSSNNGVPWSGIPYGVGLFVSGLTLSKACCKARRYVSALFWAEHYAEVRFGGSTVDLKKCFDDLSNNGNHEGMTNDISGFPIQLSPIPCINERSSLLRDSIDFLNVMIIANKALEEEESLDALSGVLSGIQLMQDEFLGPPANFGSSSLNPIETLAQVDSAMVVSNSRILQTTGLECLSSLHLYGTLQLSVEGMAMHPDGAGEFGSSLREKWFESALFSFGTLEASSAEEARNPPIGSTHGFCESLGNALSSYGSGDHETCKLYIANARFSVISDVLEKSINDDLSGGTIVDKLSCLNVFDSALGDQSNGVRPEVLYRAPLGFKLIRDESLTGNLVDPPRPYSDMIHERLLRHLSREDGEAGMQASLQLSNHLWKCSTDFLQSGRLTDSQMALQKLYTQRQFTVSQPDFLRVRQLESRILEKKGNYPAAIRHCLQSLDQAISIAAPSQEQKEITAELMIACGRLQASYRVDSGESLFRKYLDPGTELAQSILEANPTAEAGWRVTEACIALGDLVYSIYETVSERVKAPDWKKSGESLLSRKEELDEAETIFRNTNKRKKAGSELDGWMKDLYHFKQNLKRDTENIAEERRKVEASIDEYKMLSLLALVRLLGVADDSYLFMSKFVYRMVSLWLDSKGETIDPIDIGKIPSYRFVPMWTQILSRLDTSRPSLRHLVERMSSEHPYHCLPQLVRIAKGTLSANDREKEKADVALSVLNCVKADSHHFLSELVESHERLLNAYVILSEESVDQLREKAITFDRIYTRRKQMERLDRCLAKADKVPCVLTKPPLLRPNCRYGDGIEDPVGGERIAGFEPSFNIAESGITRPKVVVCRGTKGLRHKQLVKGGVSVIISSFFFEVTAIDSLYFVCRMTVGEMQSCSKCSATRARYFSSNSQHRRNS